MANVSRRTFMFGMGAGALAVSGCASTAAPRASFRYRLGLSQPLDSPNYLRLKEMADRVRAETDGAMQIEVHGAGALGSDNQMLAMVQKGELDLYMAGKLKLDELISRRLPIEQINDAFDLMERGEVARSVIQY